MCGICGFNFDDRDLITKMSDLIYHRGPDDDGYFTDSKVSLGVRRLSVIDLSTGHQPQCNENNDIWIVFNGEIVNFLNLKKELESKGHNFSTKSDTEVIIHAYEEWGEKCLSKFRGQFAFCIYDSRKQILFLARDPLGLKPLYYFYRDEKFIFASEIKCILSHNVDRILNREALNYFLSMKYVPFNFTLLKEILKLPPSSYLVYNLRNKELNIEKYWNLNFKIDPNKSLKNFTKQLRTLLEESVKLRMISDVPLGAFLSGGLDSTAIVGLMSKLSDKPIKTISVGFEEGALFNELEYARSVAEYYNTDHKEIIVKAASSQILPKIIWHLDDLIADAATIPIYLMSKYAKNEIKVALTGDGADEIFGGYSVFYRRQKFNMFKYVPQKLLDFSMKFYDYIPNHLLRIGLSYINQSKNTESRFLRKIIHIPDEESNLIFPYHVEKIKPEIKNTFLPDLGIINQFINWDLKYQLPNQFNMKIDKMTMGASLEARLPFLDYKIVELAAQIPPTLKLHGNIEKYILRLAVKDLIPKRIVKRKKTGFNVPLNLWLKTGFRRLSENLLERLQKREKIINPHYVKIIRRNRFTPYFENRVWNLMMFELWYETFIENNGMTPIEIY